jgi:serine/threonine protein kinase
LLNDDTPAEAVDLILKLLHFVPGQRITAQQALDHPFFNEIKKKALKVKSRQRPKDTTLIGHKRPKSEEFLLDAPPIKRKKRELTSTEIKPMKAMVSGVSVKRVK